MIKINRQEIVRYFEEKGRKGRAAFAVANNDMEKRRELGWKVIAFQLSPSDDECHVLYEEIDPR